MALVGRATVWWLLGSFFLLSVVLRLDGSTQWRWFVVFIPIWLLDCFTIVYLITSLVVGARNNRLVQRINEFQVPKERAVYLLIVMTLKLLFGLLLCTHLDGHVTISYFYLFIPLWLMLSMVTGMSIMDTWRDSANHPHRQ